MTQISRNEKTAHLVLKSVDPDKYEQLTHVQDYDQVRNFVETQPPENNVTFDWHFLNSQLSRRLSICMARQAIHPRDDMLEIPRFVAHAIEPQLPSHEIVMGSFCLQAHDVRDPSELYQRYAALRERMMTQDNKSLRGAHILSPMASGNSLTA